MTDLDIINNYLDDNNSVLVPVAVLNELEQMAGVRIMLEVTDSKDEDTTIEKWVFEEIDFDYSIQGESLTIN